MARSSLYMIVVGGGVVLVMLVLLYRATRSEAVPIETTTTTTPAQARRQEATPVTTPAAPTTGTAAPAQIATKPKPSSPRDSWAPPAFVPAAPSEASQGSGSSTENLHFGVAQLRTQTAAVDSLVRECVEKALVAGGKPSGTAVLTHVVTKRGDKYVVEDPGFDEGDTTIQQQPLVDCMSQTAKQMTFEGLPRGASSIIVTRNVTIEGGALTEHKFVKFSYLY